MSRKFFTEEEMATLRQNPYVYSVSPTVVILTKAFKEIFYAEYQQGAYPRAIFEKYGLTADLLGKSRLTGMAQHIKEEYAKYGSFHEGRRASAKTNRTQAAPPTTEDEIKSIKHELDYLKQEVSFLKKISSLKNTRK